ncbi:hypothetical protein SEVIR_6G242800v4 [Setaria viridis]|uniref:KIB1-4 beta-propeller domain-containing protein n=2 Tax=Setaria TaxID=4554 RepID=A0A368RPV3_SETIT|nr:uncharacterized protein LOC111257644 [Setaria italica]XP_034599108.1 uncharacterized protein LOC117860012 [Setaria viridis]RCV32171.1 hypothetical protein SETIT_6G236400v2 [Setaria italica]TKW11605.1 hypothetical protein SEVIR_6G242800v2 [Setaria viridis]
MVWPRAKMASCSAPAYFPPELIPEVARWLTSLQDFFALRASCRAYRAALPLTPSNLASQAPLLLVYPDRDQATESSALYHLPLRRLLRFRLPRARQDSSSSFFSLGCRVVICDYMRDLNRRELRMVHLLTGEQTRLPSPAAAYPAFILSGDLIVNWGYFGDTIQSYRLGAADWSVASIREHYKYKCSCQCFKKNNKYKLDGMVCVNGTIYVLVSNSLLDSPVYHLAVVELSDDRNSAGLVVLGELHPGTLELPVDTELYVYLAECRGELILIVIMEDNPRVYRVFEWKSGEGEWVRITSLGGCALFFASEYFVGCLGPDHPGIRKDCIYVNEEGLWSEYSSVDGSFRQSDAVYPEGKLQETFTESSSVWVFPSMC